MNPIYIVIIIAILAFVVLGKKVREWREAKEKACDRCGEPTGTKYIYEGQKLCATCYIEVSS